MNAGALTDLLGGLEEVGEGENATGLKNAMDLGVATRFVRHQKQRVLADDVGEAARLVRHLRGRAMAELDVELVPQSFAGEFLLRERYALLAEIEPIAAAAKPFGEVNEKVTAATTHVQDGGRLADLGVGRQDVGRPLGRRTVVVVGVVREIAGV